RVQGEPIQVHTLPGNFAPLYWEPDPPKVRSLVAGLFYGVTLEDLASTPVEIINASGTPALGRRVADRVAALGFRSVRLTTAANAVEVTTIINRTGRRGMARMLASALGNVGVRQEPGDQGPAITILLARDAARTLSASTLRTNGP
ncbi:MAG: LytR C-terminal domain-containing protein, partial [Armatimonadetes bacterium]|nr:LytR C-terminal domain-containing protein [Armatimonadota bacterium]